MFIKCVTINKGAGAQHRCIPSQKALCIRTKTDLFQRCKIWYFHSVDILHTFPVFIDQISSEKENINRTFSDKFLKYTLILILCSFVFCYYDKQGMTLLITPQPEQLITCKLSFQALALKSVDVSFLSPIGAD
jgi:hypothetical protein